MQIIKRNKMILLLADENKMLREKNDIYKPATEEEEEHIPYTTDMIFLPIGLTEKEIQEMYVEE